MHRLFKNIKSLVLPEILKPGYFKLIPDNSRKNKKSCKNIDGSLLFRCKSRPIEKNNRKKKTNNTILIWNKNSIKTLKSKLKKNIRKTNQLICSCEVQKEKERMREDLMRAEK